MKKKNTFLQWLPFIVVILVSISGTSQTTVVELENGTLLNGATIQNCSTCSNTMVGNLGGSSNGGVSIVVNLENAGSYSLKLFYCTGDPRTIYITPNAENHLVVPCPASGGWTTVANKSVILNLKAGTNTITFDNADNWGPNLDKIELTALTTSNIQSISFGENNHIDYDLNNGFYDIYFGAEKIIDHAAAYAYSDQTYQSTDYQNATYTSSPFTDDLGSGTKHIITLSASGKLDMQQVFYTYNDSDFVVTQVILKGAGSNCYKMSPLTSSLLSPYLGSGDTRALNIPYDNDAWVRYDAMNLEAANFTSSEVTGIYNNTNRDGLLIGSIEHSDWKTGVSITGSSSSAAAVSVIAGWTNPLITRDKRGHGWVGVGATSCASPKIMIAKNSDWRSAFEDYGAANASLNPKYIHDWVDAKPFGWNSWGAIQTKINLSKSKAVVDFFDNDCAEYVNGDNTLYIDLDSYWDNMTDQQLAQFVTYCKSKGFEPGIYWAPFVDWGKWNRGVEGSTYYYESCWTKVNGQPFELDGAYAMDPTHPATKERIDYFVNRFKNAGFTMVKIDFLTHASIEADSFYDPAVHTGTQAYNEGMKYLIDALGDDFLVYAAISPNVATGPYAHMRRIACDAYKSIEETDYTLNSTTYGWWQNQMYDYIDADNVVFDNVSLGENRARLASSVVTGTVMVGDDFSQDGAWTSRAKILLQNKRILSLAKKETHFVPIEGNTGSNASELFSAIVGDSLYLAVFNYSKDNSKTYSINLDRIGLNTSETYQVDGLFQGTTTTASNAFEVTLPAADAEIFAFYNGNSLSVSDEKSIKNAMSLYPNPAQDYVQLHLPVSLQGKLQLQLFDISGKKIWNVDRQVNSSEIKIERGIDNLPSGFYVLAVSTVENQIYYLKLLKD